MQADTFKVKLLDVSKANEMEYQSILKFRNAINREKFPLDKPKTLSRIRNEILEYRQFKDRSFYLWYVWKGKKVIACLYQVAVEQSTNRHVLHCTINVLAAYRRKGIARSLLEKVIEKGRLHKREIALFSTYQSSGAAFAQTIGGERGLSTWNYELNLDKLNLELIREWIHEGKKLEGEFELGFWDGPYPEEELESIASMLRIMDGSPRGNLQVEDQRITPAEIKFYDNYLFGSGRKRWVFYVKDRQSAAFVGYTEISWVPEQETVVIQGETGVWVDFRGLGLGKWLKAAMLKHILANMPNLKTIRSSNADSNSGILDINQRLGFRPAFQEEVWQVKLQKIGDYLNNNKSPP